MCKQTFVSWTVIICGELIAFDRSRIISLKRLTVTLLLVVLIFQSAFGQF